MSIKSYFENDKKLYEVFVKGRDANGKQVGRRREGIESEFKAKKIEFELKKELEALADVKGAWTWKSWYEECLRRMRLSLQNGTVEHYDFILKKWVPKNWYDRALKSFTKADVHETIFETIAETATANTQRDVHRRINRIFEMAIEDGILSTNPAKGIRVKVPESKQAVLNATEVELLLQTAKETKHRFYSVWVLALLTGMRSGEMYSLRWCDVDLEAEMISVNKQWTSKDGLHPTKSGRNRLVPINPDLKRFLSELKLKGGHSETLFDGIKKQEVSFDDFVLPRLDEWTRGLQAEVLQEFCEALNITRVRFHDLRATFITNMLAHGVSLVTVMAIVGHSRMSTTDRYVRLAGVGLKDSTKKLSYSIPQTIMGEVIHLFGKSNERTS